MNLKKRKILFLSITIIVLLAITYLGFVVKETLFSGFNISKTTYIYIDEKKSYDKLLEDLQHTAKIENISAFKRIASLYDYPQEMKTGRFAIEPSTTVQELLHILRGGHQTPVNLKFNNIRMKQDFAVRISEQLMIPKEQLLSVLNDSTACTQLGFTPETIDCMFIPNTYQFYWDVSLNSFLNKMKKEYDRFWTEERKTKAKEQGLTPIEVSILASIVEEECTYSDEYSAVAGLYLNRLRKGQLLQADPTVKFAVGDFSLRRILFNHLTTDSPYNTYKYKGLPPGPIRIPSIKGIESVLNPKTHDYFYMCAKEDFSGRHSFAKTHPEHVKNAEKYRIALNKRGIYK